jgi:Fe-Mn family superoxide dismutase
MNRRDTLKFLVGATAFAGTVGVLGRGAAFAQAKPFTLPPLGYANDALEPNIDARTMQIHHDNHHAAYVNNLNNNVDKWPEMATKPIDEILSNLSAAPEAVRTLVRNNLGGHWNHTFFWDLMTPGGAKEPSGEVKSAIESSWKDVADFKERFAAAGAARFGSGWAWLVVNKDKKIELITTANQDTPVALGAKAIIGVDVWEHAYYLKYQNRRAEYLKAWWNVVNWDKAAANLKKASA